MRTLGIGGARIIHSLSVLLAVCAAAEGYGSSFATARSVASACARCDKARRTEGETSILGGVVGVVVARVSAREHRRAWIEAERRRCLVAVCIAAVRASALGAAVNVEFRGERRERASRVCVYDRVARMKYISYSRLLSITRGCSLPGILIALIVGRHEKRGFVFRTTSTLSLPLSPASRVNRYDVYVSRTWMRCGRLDACADLESRLCAFSEERTVARCVLAAMGNDGWEGDSRYVEKENAEVVGRANGKGISMC